MFSATDNPEPPSTQNAFKAWRAQDPERRGGRWLDRIELQLSIHGSDVHHTQALTALAENLDVVDSGQAMEVLKLLIEQGGNPLRMARDPLLAMIRDDKAGAEIFRQLGERHEAGSPLLDGDGGNLLHRLAVFDLVHLKDILIRAVVDASGADKIQPDGITRQDAIRQWISQARRLDGQRLLHAIWDPANIVAQERHDIGYQQKTVQVAYRSLAQKAMLMERAIASFALMELGEDFTVCDGNNFLPARVIAKEIRQQIRENNISWMGKTELTRTLAYCEQAILEVDTRGSGLTRSKSGMRL